MKDSSTMILAILIMLCFVLFLLGSIGTIVSVSRSTIKAELNQPTDSLYPTCGIVTTVDHERDTVEVTDFNGKIWCFYGTEDWQVNDIAAMIMSNNDTASIYDDIIMDVRYCGYLQ